MSDIINILPDSVANQIAAGEVVDRPASAVKELLENSMDAGATQIDLIVKDAGRTLIQVVDNGCGMSDTDARLCFERHATSKIHQADDLFAIHTMGFRGEALASIAAIAQVELRTRLHDAELGTALTIEGSHIRAQQPQACPPGTSLSVKNLFFNVPARRNFLKKDSVEFSHIEEVFRRVTLVHYDIGFTLNSNGKLLYDLKAGSMLQRIAQLFGDHYKERLYAVEETTDIVKIKGFVGKPEYARRARNEQFLFVNGRYIKHLALSTAVESAYADMLPDRAHPSYFIALQVDPASIDINIHPTKTEVKFLDESMLFSLLRSAVKKALGQFTLAAQLEFNPSTDIDFTPAPRGYVPQPPKVPFNPDYNPFQRPTPKQRTMTEMFESPIEVRTTLKTMPLPEVNTDSSCMQFQHQYIITTLSSGIAIIDQQRAHERILYDRLMNSTSATNTQTLLFPISCQFSAADAELFSELLPDLKEYGFQIEPVGQRSFVVTATPSDLKESELQAFFDRMLSDYRGSTLQKYNDRNQSLCASLARQLAIRPGTPLSQEEMQQMVADLFACPMAQTDPSGRRIITIVNPTTLFKQ